MTTPSQTASHYFLEALVELGIEYLFCNLGTDHAPIIEEMARWKKVGLRPPKVILCPHENTAVHMAAGYAIATGRGQAVLVHVDAGTANASMGLHNLFRARIPVLLMAGRAPFSTYGELPGCRDTYVHFMQEPFDQGSVVRPYVKWEYTLQSPAVVKEVLARAHTVMQSDPMGPVYLMLPREILAAEHDASQVRPVELERNPPVKAGGARIDSVQEIAQRLLQAENPLLITAYAGRNSETPALIDELARFAGIRVCEFNPIYLNIRRDSPCFAGYQPGPYVKEADVGLLVDVDVPWIPKTTEENPETWWAQLDVDASKRDMPMWSFPTQLRIEGDSHVLLSQLLDEIKKLASPDFLARAKTRLDHMAKEHVQQVLADQKLAAETGSVGQINPNYLCALLGQSLQADDIVINEAVRNVLPVFSQISRTKGGTLVGMPAGGLSFSGGAALGMKLAQPDRTVVQIVGDGTFYFSNPSSVYAVARQYGVPIFTVVLDNSGWSAVKQATLRMYPDGEAYEQDEFSSTLAPDTNMAKLAESAGAYGELLEDPREAEAAIARCLAAVRDGRAAVLHARVSKL
ncbi:MAG: thiamine pyrophosphate-requiring protein [Pigmentiphaga sp.]